MADDSSARTRTQRVWDAIVVGAAGTFAATLMAGVCYGMWNMYNGVQRVETMQKAMNMVITDKLARLDTGRMDELERQLKAVRDDTAQHHQELVDLIDDMLDTIGEEKAKAVRQALEARRKAQAANKPPQLPQVQDHDQQQQQQRPADWQRYDRTKRRIQEQIQQQQEMLK